MAAGTRREQAAAETRKLILEAAKELYMERGYKAVLSKALARKAGVAEGTVFAHFPDKATLLAAALHEDLQRILALACEAMPSGAPCREKVLGLARALYEYYALRPGLSRALVKESLFLPGEWGERVLAEVQRVIALLAGWVGEAKLAGAYAPDIDDQMAARSMFGAYFTELLMALSFPVFDVEEALRMLDAHLRRMERGLVNR